MAKKKNKNKTGLVLKAPTTASSHSKPKIDEPASKKQKISKSKAVEKADGTPEVPFGPLANNGVDVKALEWLKKNLKNISGTPGDEILEKLCI